MGFTAVHADWGRLDASLDDLGCGRAWADVHRVTGLRLACPECGGRVCARVSSRRARHFYHQQRPRDCELANESYEHHLLKLELATAARAAGFTAELEVSSPRADWRADVLVFDEQGRAFMALEAQLSPMTPEDARMRTDRYARDGVGVCWVGLQGRPWQRAVPSLRVEYPEERGAGWTVRHGIARYTWDPRTLAGKAGWTHITCPLGDAIRWILQGRVHPHTGPGGTVWWTADAYRQLAAARAKLEADDEAAARARAAEQARRAAAARAAAAEQRLHDALQQAQERQAEQERLAAFLEHAGIDAQVWPAFTQLVRTASGKPVEYGVQSPSHGNGLLVYSRPRPGRAFTLAGVVCPDPRALAQWPAELTILVPSQTWLARIQAAARTPLKVAVLNPTTKRCAFLRIRPQPPDPPAPPGSLRSG
ncbi:competence protein CoiA [Streptomyces sp. NBC_00557]|uniref:competence protein CoiA n=1 Tax=Streptomyces sp. NBC_00557 TaxID=2975776 RepID=UPI002E80C546|nr:competence protein CoiA family protein [Streptomyces sp. NBC_00557]WUC39706.1 competence protein CoiA family protein [Streptomyces sp. NBC_00557]